MARIRSIKPDFWTSAQVMDLPLDTRLLFIGMWNFCDDAGIHPASEKRLKAEVFPGDDIGSADVRRMIDELIEARLITEYEVDSERFWIVTGWHHQKIDQPTFKHPRPDGTVPDGAPKRRQMRLAAETSAGGGRAIDERSPNTGRTDGECSPPEGKGEEGKGVNTLSGRPDASTELIDYLNQKAGRSYQHVKANLDLVGARLREGATVETIKAVIDAKVKAWKSDPKMADYLRPETLFGAKKFAQYSGQLGNQTHSDDVRFEN